MTSKDIRTKVDLRKITLTINRITWSLLMHSYTQWSMSVHSLPCFFVSYSITQILHFPALPTCYYLSQFLFLGRLSMQELNQASRVLLSPYLCPDCSETWNHSPHYRWLFPENQKRSDWPQTHGDNVCRDSSPLRNLFECHLRWKAPFLKAGGDRGKSKEKVTEVREGDGGNKDP